MKTISVDKLRDESLITRNSLSENKPECKLTNVRGLRCRGGIFISKEDLLEVFATQLRKTNSQDIKDYLVEIIAAFAKYK